MSEESLKHFYSMTFLAIGISLMLTACGAGELLGPTISPSPTNTSTPTATLTSTATPTVTPTSISRETPTITPTPTVTPLGGAFLKYNGRSNYIIDGKYIRYCGIMTIEGTIITEDFGNTEPEKNCVSEPAFYYSFKTSPDGSRYAHYQYPAMDQLVIGEFSTGKTIKVIDLKRYIISRGANGRADSPRFYWLGNHKIFFIEKDNINIDIVDVETGSIKNLGQFPSAWPSGYATIIEPSTDGKFILVEAGNSESDNLILVASDGSGSKNMTADLGVKKIWSGLAWSPDSSRFTFSAYLVTGDALVIEKADGTLVKIIETNHSVESFWSPDGNQIAFACTINKSDANICLTDSEGNNLTSFPTETIPGFVTWSPDGKKIVYLTDMYKKHYQVNILWPDSGINQKLFAYDRTYHGFFDSPFFRWSPDSTWILIRFAGQELEYMGNSNWEYSPMLCDLQNVCHDFFNISNKFAVTNAEWAFPISINR
jgi:Tol biopolymer transport system component